LAVAACTAALAGCVSAGSDYQVENATGRPIPHHALADEVYLDGTGVTARNLAQPQSRVVERRYAEPLPAGAPTRAVVRSRPTAIERADNVSSTSTTGSRTSGRADASASKPFSDQWWENERRQDERLKRMMDICRGC
jgi:tartrate dehydratase beta subunit/fumarate hydratase class I family protein